MNLDSNKTNTLLIQTGDGIEFPLFLASPVTRFVAWLVDCACIAAASNLISAGLAGFGWLSWDVVGAVTTLAYFAISIGYGIAWEWYGRGQTLGKRLLRLRVVDAQGLRLQFNQIFVRNLLRALDALPLFYLVGGITSLLNRSGQRLGDLAANTVVIRLLPGMDANLEQLFAGKYNSFREHPHLVARLRQKTTPAEAGIALEAILRREEFEPDARVALFESLARHFGEVQKFPSEATDGMTDEQYIRNVVDVLFRTRV